MASEEPILTSEDSFTAFPGRRHPAGGRWRRSRHRSARAPAAPARGHAAPDLSKSRIANGGAVEIVWRKAPFDALRIEVIRDIAGAGGSSGSDTWSFLAIDSKPNYTDSAPPPSGTVQINRYRAIYILDDQPYGQWSQPIEMTVCG